MKITTTTAATTTTTTTTVPVYKFLNLIIVASVVLTLLLNGAILTKQQRLEGGGGDDNGADLSLLQPQRTLKASNNNNNNNNDNNNNKKKIRPKILVGIFVDDTFQGCSYRKRHRSLFGVWNDTRVCSLVEYEIENDSTTTGSGSGSGSGGSIREQCELIYTFVAGVNKDPNGPTEIVDNSTHKLLVERPVVKAYKQDCLIFCGFEHDFVKGLQTVSATL
jgi:hypothetical protein